jgi:glycine dehydrogenase subunit 1
MMASLTGMDVSNASVYDGASGLAEAVLMAVRANKKNKAGRVLVAESVHPHYTQTTRNIVRNQNVAIAPIACDANGRVDAATLDAMITDTPPSALIIQQPNFFGGLEAVDAITDWAHAQGALVIAVVNPMSLGILKPPGEWGEQGADIAVGDGQPFGVPMASGGPSFGFICARGTFMRQLPGRIIGRTEDLEGRVGYALTLQAREQHIRRGKATSNICTNQGLLVTAGTIYMSLMGPQGIRETALDCHRKANALRQRLLQVEGVSELFAGPTFHEFALKLPVPATGVVEQMMQQGILAGLNLADFSGGTPAAAEQGLLVAVTEKRTEVEMDQYVAAFTQAIAAAAGANT